MKSQAGLGIRSMTLDSIEITVGGRWSTDVIHLTGDLISDLLCGGALDTGADVGDGQSRFSVIDLEDSPSNGNTIIGTSKNSSGVPGGIGDLVGGSAKGEPDALSIVEAGLNGDERINIVDLVPEAGTALTEFGGLGAVDDLIGA